MSLHFLAIDIGNTTTKIAHFQEDSLLQQWRIESKSLQEGLQELLRSFDPQINLAVGWISTAQPVALEVLPTWQRFAQPPRLFPIQSTTDLPIVSRYSTPHTLGTDRIVAVIAACSYSEDVPVLVIDLGTAITYDFADAEHRYRGGGISPGVKMRLRALHEFTARLPLVEPQAKPAMIGNSTEASIRSGVVNGCLAEVQGTIDRYRAAYGGGLQVFLTGGDQYLFENQLKNVNFAASNLVLEGIKLCIQHLIST